MSDRDTRKLLIVGRFPDADFVGCDYIFLYHLVVALQEYFARIDVIAPAHSVPNVMAPASHLSKKIREGLAKQDYVRDKIHVHFAHYPPWSSRISKKRHHEGG